MPDDWFRSPDWDADAQAEFERRLGRARPWSRPQYLRIKGLSLVGAGELAGARALWLRVLEDPDADLDRWHSLEHLGDLDAASDPEAAEGWYRQLLAEDPTLNATSCMAEVRLAALLTRKGTAPALAEAWGLLEAWPSRRMPFPANHFEWELARARWGEAAGRADVVRGAARHAIELVDARSPFSRHPTIGLVQIDPEVMEWLGARA